MVKRRTRNYIFFFGVIIYSYCLKSQIVQPTTQLASLTSPKKIDLSQLQIIRLLIQCYETPRSPVNGISASLQQACRVFSLDV
jgi:hypothetical protein